MPDTTKSATVVFGVGSPGSDAVDRRLAARHRRALEAFRSAVAEKKVSKTLRERARAALMHFGGDPWHSRQSLKDYDHERNGPFLGVSDDGGAAEAICAAALASPKVRACRRFTPLEVGVAVDAERLGGIGETAVGPDEYADVWLACVDRVLITTNVGTRVNVRVYSSAPRVVLTGTGRKAIDKAKREITAAFAPFVRTPDGRPRPLVVFVEIPRKLRAPAPTQQRILQELAQYVSSGQAAGGRVAGFAQAPVGQSLGLAVHVEWGKRGKTTALAAIDLAAYAELHTVMIDGIKRRQAYEAISYAGLLDYFAPGIIGPLLRYAKQRGIHLRTPNLPDTDTIARSIWVGLTTARGFGANLGKYGCFPLTLDETDRVVGRIEGWLSGWSAAPVLFVDQGILEDEAIHVSRDLPRGLRRWLQTVAARGAQVVLIDTIDKAKAGHLLRRASTDKNGFLSLRQVERVDAEARRLGVKVLWAGGLSARDSYEMGRLGVFGLYVTSAAAKRVPVKRIYAGEIGLAASKEPQGDAVLRVKILLEAGFLSTKLSGAPAGRLMSSAERLLAALDAGNAAATAESTEILADLCRSAWPTYWRLHG
jgi:hypothetical protein